MRGIKAHRVIARELESATRRKRLVYRGGSRPRREVLDIHPRGFLVGIRGRWFYDLDGRFVRVVEGGRNIVEWLGPRAVEKRLSEDERGLVRRARRAAKRREWAAKARGRG